jgi:transposase
MKSEEDAFVMHVLHVKHGWSIAKLAEEFDVDWRTAKRYASTADPPAYGPRECPAELTAAQLAHVVRRLELCEALRATTLFREVTALGYTGSYASFIRRVRLLRPVRELDPPLRFETDPGLQLQIDWADCGAWLVRDELVQLYALVAVLGFSRMVAVRFATNKLRRTTLRLVVELLHDLGGVPGEILSDRDAAFVIGALQDGRAVFAPEWIDLADTLGTTPKACKPYRAKTKGKVERVIRELKEDFLCWVTGLVLPARPTLDDYAAAARRWCVEVIAPRRHRTTGRVVAEAWAEERPLLRPIPARILHATTKAQVGSGCDDPSRVACAPVRASTGLVSAGAVANGAREAGSDVEHRSLDDYDVGGR